MAKSSRSASRSSARRSATSEATRPRWRRWAMWLIVPGLLLAVVGATVLFVLMAGVPLPSDIAPAATTVLDVNGEVVGTLAGDVTREDVAIEDLPDHVVDAVLAAEDRDYYEHGGVSVLGITRALIVNVRAGEVQQGGSTITQQYVKNAVVGDDQTLYRKVNEAAIALKLERTQDKDTILEWYLNTIYWGRGAVGIGAAAETYYGIPATDLTVNQAATLAGIIQAPEGLDPAEEPEAADRRRQYVLGGMLEEGWIGQAEHDALVAEGLPEVSDRTASRSQVAPYYLDAVRRELVDLLGDEAIAQDLTIHTGLEGRAVNASEEPFLAKRQTVAATSPTST